MSALRLFSVSNEPWVILTVCTIDSVSSFFSGNTRT
jgi:hypothetical protein